MWINELELCPTLKPFLWIVPWDTNMRKFSISVSVFPLSFLHNSHLIVCIRLLFLLSVFNYLLVCYCSMNFKNAKGNTLYKCDICVDWIDCVVWVNFAVMEFFVWSALVYTHRIGLPPWIILNFLRKPITTTKPMIGTVASFDNYYQNPFRFSFHI